MIRKTIAIIILSFTLGSCGIYNSNRIFYLPKKESFSFQPYVENISESPLEPGDRVSFLFYPNHGENALLAMATIDDSKTTPASTLYLVNSNGDLNLPMVGSIHVQGLTCTQAIKEIVTRLEKDFQSPFVQLEIVNQRALLINGKGAGQQIDLVNQNTTLMEIIAQGGGVKEFANSEEIRLFRLENNVRKAYQFNLADINNAGLADVKIKNRDIIVINHQPRNIQNSLKEVGPWLSILTSGLAIFAIFMKI